MTQFYADSALQVQQLKKPNQSGVGAGAGGAGGGTHLVRAARLRHQITMSLRA
jgi:hypothetical protein